MYTITEEVKQAWQEAIAGGLDVTIVKDILGKSKTVAKGTGMPAPHPDTALIACPVPGCTHKGYNLDTHLEGKASKGGHAISATRVTKAARYSAWYIEYSKLNGATSGTMTEEQRAAARAKELARRAELEANADALLGATSIF